MNDADALERELSEACRRYHESGDSPLTDDEYDAGLDRLAELRPRSPLLRAVGHAVAGRDAVPLPRRMGSLEKRRTDAQLEKALAAAGGDRFVLSDKLDGQSALLHVPPGGGPVRMYTRGDGRRGRDVSRFVHSVDGVPRGAAAALRAKGIEFVRGELVAPKAAKPGAAGPALRSFVTGVINSNSPSAADLALVHFVAYEACGAAGAECAPPSEQLAAVEGVLKHVVHRGRAGRDGATAAALTETLVSRKAESDYGIDGIVVAADAPYTHDGDAACPAHAFAFKSALAESGSRTRVVGVEWRATRHGRLAPTLLVEPVTVNGSRVSRASGKSARNVHDGGLGVGAEVELVMAGDVIPDVRRVIKASDRVPPPDVDHEWDANRVHYVTADGAGGDGAALEHLFSALPVKGFGRSVAARLAEAGVRDVFSLLDTGAGRLNAILGGSRGQALRTRLHESLRTAPRPALADALGVFPQGVGRKTIALALRSGETAAARLRAVGGIGPETAPKVELGMERLASAEERLRGLGVAAPAPDPDPSPGGGRPRRPRPSVAFTGVRDAALERLVRDSGGEVASSVSASTDYLVTRDGLPPDTSKGKRAARLGVPAVTPAALRAALR
eukprot:jgi/Tetstr1/464167/TSEL_008972.t1